MSDSKQTEEQSEQPSEETIDISSVDQSTDDTLDESTNELTELREKAEANWELYLRAQAEMENLRRRSEKDLENALFVNYCKCVKKIKYSRNYSKGSEYPICISSIYTKRNRDPPKGIIKRCSEFRW